MEIQKTKIAENLAKIWNFQVCMYFWSTEAVHVPVSNILQVFVAKNN